MPEQLALAEDVDHPAAIDELDRAPADYPDLVLWPSPLRKDRRAGGEELDLGSFSEPLEGFLVEPTERVIAP